MFLYRIPKVESIEELQEINKVLSTKKNVSELKEEICEISKRKNFIYQFQITIDKYSDGSEISIIPPYHNAAYWRKFNALHNWFVANVRGGNDNCEYYLVKREHIEKLLLVLETTTQENCESNFPTTAGFFFGGTGYGEWYWHELKKTIHICHYLLSEVNWKEEVLMYRSSW